MTAQSRVRQYVHSMDDTDSLHASPAEDGPPSAPCSNPLYEALSEGASISRHHWHQNVQHRDDCDSQTSEPEVSDDTVRDEHKHVDKHSVDLDGPQQTLSLDDETSEGTLV
jgi:hypothetical protein